MKASKQVPISLLIVLGVILTACGQEPTSEPDRVKWSSIKDPIEMESKYEFPGDLLLESKATDEIIALNGKTHQVTQIFQYPKNSNYRPPIISTDGKTLLISYQEGEENGNDQMYLLTYKGKVTTIDISLPDDIPPDFSSPDWIPTNWVNGEYVQGYLFDKEMMDYSAWEVRLYNPFQGEWMSLSDYSANIDQYINTGFSISPDLTRVLYVNEEIELVLFDLETEKELWTYQNYDGYHPIGQSSSLSGAVWSNDGEHLAIEVTTMHDTPAILILNKNGEVEHSLYFGILQVSLRWSTDDSHLWFYEYRCSTEPLDIDCDTVVVIRSIDMKDGLLCDNYAINLDKTPPVNIGVSGWEISPDGRFQALSLYNNSTMYAYEPFGDGIILFNISDPQLRQISIDHNYDLFGWSSVHWEKPALHQ